jgi:dienelactone hydrolase
VTSAEQRCGTPAAPSTPVRIVSKDGAKLAAYEAGTGRRGVVLVPELGSRNLCGWWAYATLLVRRGFRVLLFDHQCAGQSACAAREDANSLLDDIGAATAALSRDGAHRIVLVGASQGGSEVVIAGAHPPRGVVGVVALSADRLAEPLATTPFAPTARRAATTLRVPSLFAVAHRDPYVSVAESRRLVASVPAGAQRLLVLPSASGHGWDMLTLGPSGARHRLSRRVAGFLTRVTS